MKLSRTKYARNTPTHVGKTRGKHVPHTAQEKHPHARGEDSILFQTFNIIEETPPRTWGRLITKSSYDALFGNTPTHVGKTLASFRKPES